MTPWRRATLSDVATIERAAVHPARIRDGTLYVGLENIESGGAFLNVRPVANGELASGKFAFSSAHVLYGKLRPYLAKIAAPCFSGICSTDILPILPGPDLDRRFLLRYLRQPQVVQRASSLAAGINLPRLSPTALASFEIPLPLLSEQRRIATILDQADAIRAKRRATIGKLNGLANAIFLEMFGDPVSNPRLWPTRELGEVGRLDRGVSRHRPRNAPELLGGPHPFIQTGDVANSDGRIRRYTCTYSELGLRQSKLWPAGTLCITIAANIAKAATLTFPACFPDSVVGFTSGDPATVEFVRVWLGFLQESLEKAAPESAQKNINLAILRGLQIPWPPPKLQRQFASASERLESLRCLSERSAANLELLFASLQHRAFRGEL